MDITNFSTITYCEVVARFAGIGQDVTMSVQEGTCSFNKHIVRYVRLRTA